MLGSCGIKAIKEKQLSNGFYKSNESKKTYQIYLTIKKIKLCIQQIVKQTISIKFNTI